MDENAGIKKQFGGMNLMGDLGNMEEFKMQEDDDDNYDLLNEKQKSNNMDEFYAME